MTFKERIEQGLQGKFSGLSNGFNRINKYLFGVQRGCYYLIGGLSGSAKTTLVDFIILNAIQDAEKKGININIFYHSYEIDELTKKANWLSMLIYQKYNRTITPEKIKGLGDFRLTEDEQQIVNSEIENLEKLFSKINWIWEATNPTGTRNELWRFMETRGVFIRDPYIDEHGETKQRIVKYVPNDPYEYNIVIVDHLALMKRERGFNLKENIDKFSEYCVTLRNLFGFTIFNVQQFNQGLNSVDRQKFKGTDISPSQTDFKDSTNPYTDADIVLGLLNAFKMDLETCLDYNINKPGATYNLKDRFRMLKLIKNRLSRDNIAIGLLFIPEEGRFEELKQSKDLGPDDYIRFSRLLTNR